MEEQVSCAFQKPGQPLRGVHLERKSPYEDCGEEDGVLAK
jgi:hypothetical protein